MARGDVAPRDVTHARVSVEADHVEYFSDIATVVARGHVNATLPDGSRVDGDAFAMDLQQNRVLVAGHVHLMTASGAFDGAAVSDFIGFDRVYFLPLVPSPDRWTFVQSDYAQPIRGRDMPGDAFALPDVRGLRPYVSGRRATIDAGTFVVVEPATTAILMGPETPPLPAFADNYSANPAFGQNALPGATFDAPYPFYASGHTLETLHFRVDQTRSDPYFLAFEHHSVSDAGAFAVLSLNPITQPQKQWTLVSYLPLGQREGLSLGAQLFTTQSGFSQPSSSSGFADLRYIDAFRGSSLLVDATQSYDSLITGAGLADHPFVVGAQWSGYERTIFHSGVTYRLTTGHAMIHDIFGVSRRSADIGSNYAGAVLGSPSLAGPFGSTVYASVSLQQTWLTFPNQVAQRALLVTDGKQLAPRLYGVLSAQIQTVTTPNPALLFATPNLATGLAPAPLSPNGLPVFQVPTITSRVTDRIYGLTISWQPDPKFQFTTTGERSVYTPGQPLPPSSLFLGVRGNIMRSLYLTLGRTYYFNWFGQRWSPSFTIQASGQ